MLLGATTVMILGATVVDTGAEVEVEVSFPLMLFITEGLSVIFQ